MNTLHTPTDSPSARVDELRNTMITVMRERGFLHSDRIEQAFRTVPRHRFAPEAPLEQAYDAVEIVRTKFGADGETLSSVSAPYIQAMMLEQAQIRPGDRVLEIGSGGYNAALAAELAGPEGAVTTVDIDPEVTARARRLLDAAGYRQVTAVCADAETGFADGAPYDRILVTVGAWDIPPAWTGQLAAGGRLVVPLRLLGGLTRSVALESAGEHWSSLDHQMCGFVPMRGAGAHDERQVVLHDHVRLCLGDRHLQADVGELAAALVQPGVRRWTGVSVTNNEPFDGLHVWLATTMPGFARMAADPHAVDSDLVDRLGRWNTPVAIDGASFAYLATLRANADGTQHEFGVRAHGPEAERLADHVVELVRTWDHHYRDQHARIDVHPAGADVAQHPASRVIDKHHTRVALHWPAPPRPRVTGHPGQARPGRRPME